MRRALLVTILCVPWLSSCIGPCPAFDEEDEVLSFPAIICVICFLVGVSAYSGRRLEDGR